MTLPDLYALYKKRRPDPTRPYFNTCLINIDGLYCEFGFQMYMWLQTDSSVLNRTRMLQITIRDIIVDESIQRQGVLTNFITRILEDGIAVQLESVQPRWLKKRLQASDLWVLQGRPAVFTGDSVEIPDDSEVIGAGVIGGIPEEEIFEKGELVCPSFVRFKPEKGRLF